MKHDSHSPEHWLVLTNDSIAIFFSQMATLLFAAWILSDGTFWATFSVTGIGICSKGDLLRDCRLMNGKDGFLVCRICDFAQPTAKGAREGLQGAVADEIVKAPVKKYPRVGFLVLLRI
ncbi:hypothetical protein IVB55_31615 [Bradyrhizobium sp. CW4]|nr:hypothetical protein [Bradyrhizobium sp. CW4]MCK1417420.1 hypothetical protein [Bradyrhizobium sp. CW4]